MGERRPHGLQRVLVALHVEDGYDGQVVATAIKLAARRRHGIHVVVLATVPYALPLDSRKREREAEAQGLIEQARVQGGTRVTGHVELVRPGQAGRRIVEQAVAMRATAIVMSLPRRVAGASIFGKTLETVLAERPCRVIIEANPSLQRGLAHAQDRAEVGG
jgi:basic amino acid/polyamine antiporter, APA family